jgi:Chaperone of endosialidase
MKLRSACGVVGFLFVLSLVPLTLAQTSTQSASALPRLVRFGGTVKDLNGTPLTGVVGITFTLYSEPSGGAPLWLETQNVTADSTGHYTVLLGSTKPDGLPAELFTSEQARWVGVQVSGQAEQPRVLLVSAPYALKAGDAETVGGLPPSAFVLAGPLASGSAAASAANGTAQSVSRAASDVTTTGGTVNFLPIFSGAATVIDSAVFQTGTGTTAKVGINTTTPATTLDVNGTGTVRGTLSLPATGTATATGGKNSQGLNLVASSFSSTSSTALNQTFRWQAEPAANDTTAPSGTLNLQYGLGATAPSETGLKISSKGILTFATGQTFPGAGDGSVTSVATGLGLKGGPITKTGTLTIDTTVVPQLAAANTFTKNQTVSGNVTATNLTASTTVSGGVVNAATSFELGGVTFASGSSGAENAFLGFSSGGGATGIFNTGVGSQSLSFLTSGSFNTGIGDNAGAAVDFTPITGSNNTALGYSADLGTGSLSNATAIGAYAEVTESNALVLGSISGVNFCTATANCASTNVGIGTTAPGHLLDVAGTVAFDSTGLNNGSNFIDLTFGVNAGEGISSSRTAGPNQFGIDLYTDFNRRISILQNGNVGIGTTTPDSVLSVNGSADKTGGGSWGTFSDGRLKTVNGGFTPGLSQVMKIHPVHYRYKPDNAMGIRDTDEHIGVVAQDVQKVIPEAVTENSKGYLLVNNDPIIWTMLNAIKEQQREIRSLRSELRVTRQALQKVKAQVTGAQLSAVAKR